MRFIFDYLMNTIIFSEMTKDWLYRRGRILKVNFLKVKQ